MDESQEFGLTFPLVYSYTLPILSKDESGKDQIGAGVLLEIGRRLFLATAAHCIERDPQVLPDKFDIPGSRPSIPFRRSVLHPGLDIGYLEIDRTAPHREIARGHCAVEQLCRDTPPPGLLHIIGYPCSARKFERPKYLVVKKAFGTELMEQANGYYYFAYPKAGMEVDYLTGRQEVIALETPHGFSGGGCWGFIRPGPEEMFNPLVHVKLFAIQSSWDYVNRRVKCIPISRLLELMLADADLRDELFRSFSDLAKPVLVQ